MLSLILDSGGMLRRFLATPPRLDTTVLESTSPDPSAVFKLAGLDFTRFHPTTPIFAPPTAFESRQAWTGDHPGLPHTPITVEMAVWHGKLTSFAILWPWDKPAANPKQSFHLLGVFTLVLYFAVFGCIVFYARQNIRQGRGDRKGAFRFASLAFVVVVVSWLAGLHMVPDVDRMLNAAVQYISVALACAGLFWLLYIALEPAVRARWPHSLISWNRLLAGQLRDPLLGSHVLLGCALGVALVYLLFWRNHWIGAAGAPPEPDGLDMLFGARTILEGLGNLIFGALLSGTAEFFLLCGIRALVRRDWLAALLGALVLTLQEGNFRNSTHVAVDLPVYLAIFSLLAFALLRMGLVPAILATFVANLIDKVPVSANFTAWYDPEAVFLLMICATLALYGVLALASQTGGREIGMEFAGELAKVLPLELPRRDDVIAKASEHLALIVEANQHFNLTRITTPREAAIKHILDSVLPWRLFADAEHVLDAGSGAGFPGIPLALVLPGTRFTLAESIQKRARFLESCLDCMDLHNVYVAAERAEDVLRRRRIDVITARAVAPIARAITFFAPGLKNGAKALLYKGPDVEAEIREAETDARKQKLKLRVLERYELPDAMGSRTIVEISR